MRAQQKVVKRQRKAGELARARIAIRNHCLECVGYNAAEVRRCTDHACWLWPYRFGEQRSAESVVREELEAEDIPS